LKYITDRGKSDVIDKISEREESIKMAASILREISKDEETRIQYENEMLFELDARSWVSDARREGREEGREEGWEEGRKEGNAAGEERSLQVISALSGGAPVEETAAKYSMPVERVEKIKNAMRL
jgi:predicted transposase YdaD